MKAAVVGVTGPRSLFAQLLLPLVVVLFKFFELLCFILWDLCLGREFLGLPSGFFSCVFNLLAEVLKEKRIILPLSQVKSDVIGVTVSLRQRGGDNMTA